MPWLPCWKKKSPTIAPMTASPADWRSPVKIDGIAAEIQQRGGEEQGEAAGDRGGDGTDRADDAEGIAGDEGGAAAPAGGDAGEEDGREGAAEGLEGAAEPGVLLAAGELLGQERGDRDTGELPDRAQGLARRKGAHGATLERREGVGGCWHGDSVAHAPPVRWPAARPRATPS